MMDLQAVLFQRIRPVSAGKQRHVFTVPEEIIRKVASKYPHQTPVFSYPLHPPLDFTQNSFMILIIMSHPSFASGQIGNTG